MEYTKDLRLEIKNWDEFVDTIFSEEDTSTVYIGGEGGGEPSMKTLTREDFKKSPSMYIQISTLVRGLAAGGQRRGGIKITPTEAGQNLVHCINASQPPLNDR